MKHLPRRSAGTGRRGRRSRRWSSLRVRRLTTGCQPSASGPVVEVARRGAYDRTTIRGEAPHGLAGWVGDFVAAGAERALMPVSSTSRKDGCGASPPPDLPDGGVSWLQRCNLLRPVRSPGEGVFDAWVGEWAGTVAAGVGVSAGGELVDAGVGANAGVGLVVGLEVSGRGGLGLGFRV